MLRGKELHFIYCVSFLWLPKVARRWIKLLLDAHIHSFDCSFFYNLGKRQRFEGEFAPFNTQSFVSRPLNISAERWDEWTWSHKSAAERLFSYYSSLPFTQCVEWEKERRLEAVQKVSTHGSVNVVARFLELTVIYVAEIPSYLHVCCETHPFRLLSALTLTRVTSNQKEND